MSSGPWSWRHMPILEAVLRLERLGQLATPESVAAEAVLHYDDANDGIASLVDAGYLDCLVVRAGDGRLTTVVSSAAPLRGLLRSSPPAVPIDTPFTS